MSVTHPEGDPDSWRLTVDPVAEKDEALYECQVNTRGKLSLVFKLNVQRESYENGPSVLFLLLLLLLLLFVGLADASRNVMVCKSADYLSAASP